MTLARLDPGEDHHAILVHHFWKWTQEDAFDPAEYRRVRADSQREAHDDQRENPGLRRNIRKPKYTSLATFWMNIDHLL